MLAKDENSHHQPESIQAFGNMLIPQLIIRRKELGLTQKTLGEMLGVADDLVAKWETGARKPSGFLLFCWADALGCNLTLEPKHV